MFFKKHRRRTRIRANIRGGPLAPDISGFVNFYDVPDGTAIYVDIIGLPEYQPGNSDSPIGPHGFHIHEIGNCEIGNPEEPFMDAGGHWNPDKKPHGNHAGDLPVLFSNKGRAIMCFFTNRFKPVEVIDLSVIIHKNPDDYRSQPTGNAGKRLACGIIRKIL